MVQDRLSITCAIKRRVTLQRDTARWDRVPVDWSHRKKTLHARIEENGGRERIRLRWIYNEDINEDIDEDIRRLGKMRE